MLVLKTQGVNVVIGPISNESFEEVRKYNDMVFISPSSFSLDEISFSSIPNSPINFLIDHFTTSSINPTVSNIKKFTNLIKHKLLKNVGHNVPQESPLIFSNLILEIKKYANH